LADQNNPLSQKRKTGAEPSCLVCYKSRLRWGADTMKSKLTTVLSIGLIPVLFAFTADAAPPKQSTGITYNATLLNIPNGSNPSGINDAGQIVGQYSDNQHGFIYTLTNPPSVTLIRDGTANTRAYGINNAGQVVGENDVGNIAYGFLYNGGNFTNFSVPSGVPQTVALGINSTAQIVGYGGGVVSPGGVAGPYEGFLYLGSTYEVLKVPEPGARNTIAEGINSTGEIVGYWDNGTRSFGFIYKNGTYTTINVPGSTNTSLNAINDLGQIVGVYTDTNNNTAHFFIYQNGNYDPITVLLGGQALFVNGVLAVANGGGVNGINKAGQIVGLASTSNCTNCAFVADPGVKPKK
jgi:probable HAF family extracellular repeat protein